MFREKQGASNDDAGNNEAGKDAGGNGSGPRQAPRQRARYSAIGMALVAALGGSAMLAGCDRLTEAKDANAAGAEKAAAPEQTAQVGVTTLESREVQQWDEFNGRVGAVQMVELRARVSGYIDQVNFAEGQPVRKGQVLFTIDQRPYKTALESAQAQLQRAQVAAQHAETLSTRAQDLVKDHAVSREEADNRSASLAQAQANVRAAQADVAAARLNLEFTQVRSPIDGRAGRAMLTVGNLAQADQSVLTSLASQDPVYIYFDADEHTLLRYSQGGQRALERKALPVRVALADETDFPNTGVLDFTDNQLDPGTGTIRARALLRNPKNRFTPGMFARVQLQNPVRMDAVLIDDKAILTDQDRQYVYVVGEGERAERRDVKPGRMVDGKRLVQEGLKPGDRLVVSGLQRIWYPGMKLDAKEASQAQTTASAGR